MRTPLPWGIMHDGPEQDGKPWQAFAEAAPGLTIASPYNSEPIARVLGCCQPVEANAEFIVRAVNSHDELVAACEAVLDAIERAETFDGTVLWIQPPHQAAGVHETATERLKAVLGKE